MNLSIDSLKDMGAFTGAPVEREITWKQGEKDLTLTVYVRPLSYLSAKSDIFAAKANTDGMAGRIAACICDESGQAVFTAGDITGEADPERGPLGDNLTMALLNVIGEVNGQGKDRASSKKKMKSGMSSSSTESAEDPLQKPSSESASPSSDSGALTGPEEEV